MRLENRGVRPDIAKRIVRHREDERMATRIEFFLNRNEVRA